MSDVFIEPSGNSVNTYLMSSTGFFHSFKSAQVENKLNWAVKRYCDHKRGCPCMAEILLMPCRKQVKQPLRSCTEAGVLHAGGQVKSGWWHVAPLWHVIPLLPFPQFSTLPTVPALLIAH